MSAARFKKAKFKKLVHYICYRADTLGSTKLNKILWYSDVLSYMHWGDPITQEVYKKQQFGPIPQHILAIIEELIAENKLVVREQDFFGRIKKEYIALDMPDLSVFNAREISLVDGLIEHICENHTANSISKKTHDKVWKLAEIGEVIPYYAALASRLGEITQHDMEWVEQSLKDTAVGKLTANNVADYIIYYAHERGTSITNLKLQKLLYYAQGWFLALHSKPLFRDSIEAWVHGPVVPDVYHRFKIYSWKNLDEDTKTENVNKGTIDFLNDLLYEYLPIDCFDLERMTHQEPPWIDARGSLPLDASCNNVISQKSMQHYFNSLNDE